MRGISQMGKQITRNKAAYISGKTAHSDHYNNRRNENKTSINKKGEIYLKWTNE